MIRRMMTMVRKDLRTGSRDRVIAYMLLSPFLLGLMLTLLMPVLEQANLEFAVDAGLDQAHVDALDQHGSVERLPDREAVERRVRERDDVLGVVAASDAPGYEVLVEGDEPESMRGLPHAVLDRASRIRSDQPVAEVEVIAVGSGRPELRRISTALFGYSIVVIVGMMLGFTILEEKISDTHRVYDVSPLRFGEYLLGKLGLGVLLSLVLIVPVIALPLGWEVAWGSIALLVVASCPFGLSLGLIIGMLAKDQLGAIAIMKALMPIWISLPVLGFVLPDAWLWTQWPFSNHWGVQALYLALGRDEGVAELALLSVLTGLPVLALSAALLRRRLGFAP